MDRRKFGRTTLAALLAQAASQTWPGRAALAEQSSPLRVEGDRLNANLQELSKYGRNQVGGVSRVAYSEADRQAREWVLRLMADAGLDARIDAAGNLMGRRDGRDPSLPPLMTGSHIDTVVEGGNYDGTVGALGAVEVAHRLEEARIVTRHPLEVVVFQGEEHGHIGSRAMAGGLTEQELDVAYNADLTRREGIAFIGGDPSRIQEVRRARGEIAAFVELHVEQGGTLERLGVDIGVVEGIVAVDRWNITVDGVANHGGATPMDQRQDAGLAAARFIDAVHRIVTSVPGRQVATVGQIQAHPGAFNIIPGRVDLSLEMRDLEEDKLERIFERISAETRELSRATGTTFSFNQFYDHEAAPTDERIRAAIDVQTERLGLSAEWMPSAAGHDAQSIHRIAPIGMIFVPSIGGVSHSAAEYSRPQDITNGANVLLHSLLELDRLDWS